MARPRRTLDAWPLLPRASDLESRPADEPARAAVAALIGLSALFLILRWGLPGSGLANEVARLVALWGCLGGLALVMVVGALLVGAAVVTPVMPIVGLARDAALSVLNHALHLAFVLTACGVLGILVLHGRIPGPAMWFATQALALWGGLRMCQRLARRSTA
jgi:hypothetical protein